MHTPTLTHMHQHTYNNNNNNSNNIEILNKKETALGVADLNFTEILFTQQLRLCAVFAANSSWILSTHTGQQLTDAVIC